MQVTVYVPKELEKRIRGIAKTKEISNQQVLLMPWRERVPEAEVLKKLDVLERKIDALSVLPKSMIDPDEFVEGSGADPEKDFIGGVSRKELEETETAKKTIKEKKIEKVKEKDLAPKISKADEDMLKKAQDLIKKKRPESLTGWTGGYSKDRQVGKGAK